MATKRAATGTLLYFALPASPSSFALVAQVQDFNGPSRSATVIDTTDHKEAYDSGFTSFILGLKDGGEVSMKLFWDSADDSHGATEGLEYIYDNRLKPTWELFPPGYSPTIGWSFVGAITKASHTYPVNGGQMADVTIKVSGKPTLGALSLPS